MTDVATQAANRKLLGAFYTGSETANAIARLAVIRADEAVLDPCFGGCAFLEAVRSRFVALGNRTPMERVFGVDIDPGALEFLKSVQGARFKQFFVRDFLNLAPEMFGSQFDVVVGNPPFVRHHLLTDDVVSRAQAQLPRGLKIPRTADSWLYFFHHSLRFLRRGGCLALVLPGALLNASYAGSARHAIATRFASCDMFLVRRRLFADALESPVIVIARGFDERPQSCLLSVVDAPADIVSTSVAGTGSPVDLTEKTGPWRLALVPPGARTALSTVMYRPNVAQFGSVATVHIGVVTGANRFFVLSKSDASMHQIPESALRPILSTSKQFRGLDVCSSDLIQLRRANERVLLLATKGSKSSRLSAYLTSAAATEAQHAFKCRERSIWHELDDLELPDAFLSYVIDRAPRLVLNRAGALCTNAIHRVWWRERTQLITKQGWTLSMVSSLGGLSAELYGRVCGGGALKLEPSEVAALWVPTTFRSHAKLSRAFVKASNALRSGDWEEAREIADRVILRDELGLSLVEASDLRAGHDALIDLRFSIAARENRLRNSICAG